MSFPYRLLWLFTHNQSAIVIGLRLINIALFAASLPLFRRVLLRTGASKAIVHLCLFIFILLQVVSQLAAQINYDNLVMPVIAGLLLLTLRIKNKLTEKQLPLTDIGFLVVLSMLTTLVKYAALPIVVALIAYLTVAAWRVHGSQRTFVTTVRAGWRAMKQTSRWLLLIMLLLSSLLFVERYGLNVFKYHTPIPDCDDVLTAQQCSAYGPWQRDNLYILSKDPTAHTKNPVAYSADWAWGMWFRTFFAVSGPQDLYQTRVPLPVPALAAVGAAALILVGIATKARTVWRRYDAGVLWLFVAVIFIYVASLWLTEYQAYRQTGQPVAINGRYLLLITPLYFVIGALSVYEMLRRRPRVLAALASFLILAFLWGGGAWTYVVRSGDNWYWHNSFVYTLNHGVQHVLWPITPGAAQSSRFLRD